MFTAHPSVKKYFVTTSVVCDVTLSKTTALEHANLTHPSLVKASLLQVIFSFNTSIINISHLP